MNLEEIIHHDTHLEPATQSLRGEQRERSAPLQSGVSMNVSPEAAAEQIPRPAASE